MEYQKLNEEILKNVGGVENITGLTHCITRLRFKLKDMSKAKTEVIQNLPGVVTVVQSGGQYQIVIGNHVPEVYKEFMVLSGLKNREGQEYSKEKPKGILNIFIDIVAGIFTPVINVLMAAGMIKGLLALLTAFNILDKESGTYLILNATGDGLFYFFPLFLGYTASTKFGGKPFIGMAIGAALVYPTISAAMNGEPIFHLFTGTMIESPIYVTFLGIPVILMSYTSSVIPIIAAAFLASRLEFFFSKVIPRAIRSFFVSFLTLIITVPIVFIIVGPITTWIGLLLGQVLSAANDFSPIIAGIIIGGFWQVFIMFGLHWGFVPIAMNNYATLGYDVVMMAGLATPLAMAGVTLAIFLKTKNRKLKEIAFPAFLSAFFGITEPALYGVTLARKKAFYTTSFAVAVAGAIMGIFKTRVYINGGTGIFALPRFINPEVGFDNSFIGFSIASGVAFLVGFLVTFLYAYDPKQDGVDDIKVEENADNKVDAPLNSDGGQMVIHEIKSPVVGNTISLNKIEDAAFSKELLGKGIAILPIEGKVYAPANGTVTALFPTNHAIGIQTVDGVEILIHVGMDTVNLQGKYFASKVKQGDTIVEGQLLIEFDLDALKSEKYTTVTPIVISNTKDYLDVIETNAEEVDKGNTILTIIA
ncbi:PTS glucose transporter subunit IIA [Enterococcus saccharolyticus]|uniref:beta-glucoside-specific PTS transporter subunit IIABC n=1 Tax=Enterococcus saccharolyticus TaxID=41997 RepID=UPI001E464357|nr:beta-glucoside-specific PTS transporter subunit IIABC [Enterococcus saccharolyticus]MCD5002378.1 PTS glucose transporter subunit IIA [Enterococcus saccharolyticus]